MRYPFYRLIVWCVFIVIVALSSCSTLNMQIEITDEGIKITENNQSVLFYQTAEKSMDGKYTRANYVHPLYHVNGEIITEDFPDDHYHHRGVFWTWHQIYIGKNRIGDPWLCEDFTWDVTNKNAQVSDKQAQIISTVEWKSPNWQNGQEAFARENVTITVNPTVDSLRIIDFNIKITALTDSLFIGGSENVKGYGGFSTRIKLPDDLHFYSADSLINPQTTAVQTGPWMNINGSFHKNQSSGFVIIQHPDNPGYVQPWILRRKNSMQNSVYPGWQPVMIEQDKPLELLYRIVMYNGDYNDINMNEVNY